jgi:hypothetical protein
VRFHAVGAAFTTVADCRIGGSGEWWVEYCRRVSKKDARVAFGKHVRTAERFQQVMDATRSQRDAMLERPEDKRPHPATWLNGERWNDEAPGSGVSGDAGPMARRKAV